MGTTFEEIECLAMTYIKNDLSLDWDLKNRLPVFYRRMWNYMEHALPLFNKPPVMISRLRNYTAPTWSDVLFTVESELTDGTVTVHTELTGFEIVSAGIVGEDAAGDPIYMPLTVVSYDSETGDIVLSGDAAAGTTIDLGDTIDIDFYTSGSLDATLNDTEKGILAFCIYDVWEHRFDNNALERSSKIRDANFTTISEASQTNAGTSRQKEVDAQLFDKLRMYEMNAAYMKTVMREPLF